MSEVKNIVGIIAIVLTFIAYVPYIKDSIEGKTTPHIYSWFLWSFLTYIVFGLQLSDGAGMAAWVTLCAGIMATSVFVLGLFAKGRRDITMSDTVFLCLSFLSLVMWLVAKQPVASAILATITDVLIFAPTIRKTWNKPYSETFSFYVLNSVRFLFAVIALEHFSIITALYPVTWCLTDGLFAILLKVRRYQLCGKQAH